jgi:hypothetical protein
MRVLISTMLLLFSGIAACCKVQSQIGDYADKLYAGWTVPSGIDGDGYLPESIRDVPAAMQGEVLANVLDRACSARPEKQYLVIRRVLLCMRQGAKIEVPDSMVAQIYGLAKFASDSVVKAYAVYDLAQLNTRVGWDIVVSALNDPSEDVLSSAMEAINRHAEGAAACRRFIADHSGDPSYAKAIASARWELENLRKSMNGSQQ